MKKKAKIYYFSLDDFMRKEDKLAWLCDNRFANIPFEKIEPDDKHNWINLADNDFESLLPLIDKEELLAEKIQYLIDSYNHDLQIYQGKDTEVIKTELGKSEHSIKWSRAVINDISKGKKYKFDGSNFRICEYRPFVKKKLYFATELNEMQYQMPYIYSSDNISINFLCVDSSNELAVLISDKLFDYCYLKKGNGGTQCLPLYRYDSEGHQLDNITDWALEQFRNHYKESPTSQITKQSIFHYVYAVLHHPNYRTKYELNLKREFPRIPFYDDFWQWATWGERLMDLHINYESVMSFELSRIKKAETRPLESVSLFDDQASLEEENTLANARVSAFVATPKTKLKADKINGIIEIDSVTQLTGIPSIAWEYKLGNRSALEWILDQYKERKPQDATIAEKFNMYKFADYKESVIELLKNICTVSIKTTEIINEMKGLSK